MPFDGIVMKAVYNELTNLLVGGRIEKISQPEKDEIIIYIHNARDNYKLLLSANASSARIHLTGTSSINPPTPPNFCILLRKYLAGGRITGIFQPGLERILEINIESKNEIGDMSTKTLVIEVMGKHSNIILLNQDRKITDSIKHIDFSTSRIREVLPGREYVYPLTQDKLDPLGTSLDQITVQLSNISDIRGLEKKLVDLFTGISPFIAREVVNSINPTIYQKKEASIQDSTMYIAKAFYDMLEKAKQNELKPGIIYNNENVPVEYHAFLFIDDVKNETRNIQHYDSISTAINTFFLEKLGCNKYNQRKNDLIKILEQRLGKCNKKICIQNEKLDDVADRENLRIYGELLTSNLYRIKDGDDEVQVNNYYSDTYDEMTIKLEPNISPSKNAQIYFRRYTKAKNTFEAANIQLKSLLAEQLYLENIIYQLEFSQSEEDIFEIKDELIEEGIINTNSKIIKNIKSSQPYQFTSTDGFNILVGRNNKQNDKLTLKTANNADIWLHTKNIPGSHVIIKTEKREVPDNTLIEAAVIASYFSKARMSSTVPVDYTTVRNVKKPGGAKPGFVIYENFKTIYVTPEKELVERLKVGSS